MFLVSLAAISIHSFIDFRNGARNQFQERMIEIEAANWNLINELLETNPATSSINNQFQSVEFI